MADEVPVCDVLCEAMEYLVKLGSNLRSRSESLKEKKIRKDRLKNSHAVHKAAQKVLMICELSKKSLENVETGVKKVLSIVDATQRSDGDANHGKNPKEKSGEDRYKQSPSKSYSYKKSSEKSKEKVLSSPRRISLAGKSYSIRLPRTVSLKHYMSVKVLAKQLPVSMIEKYPVYLNCNLYDDREKSVKKALDNSIASCRKTDDSESSGTNLKENIQSESFDQEKEKHVAKNFDLLDGVCNDETKNDSSENNSNFLKTERKMSEVNKHVLSDDIRETDTQFKKKRHSSLDIKEHSGDEYFKKKETMQSKLSHNQSGKDCETIDDKKTKTEKTKKRFKKLKIIDSSSSENEDLRNNVDNDVKEIKDKTINEVVTSENKENLKSRSYSEPNEKLVEYTSQENRIEPVKPLIKCVSISKLLKPDIIDVEDKSNNQLLFPISKTEKDNTKLIVHMTTKGEIKTKYMEAQVNQEKKNYTKSAMVPRDSPSPAKKIKKVRYQDEETFWKQKREEVRTFKPKKFVINVTRLPKFSNSFLNQNNLKRITQSGSILYQLSPVTNGNEENAIDYAESPQDSGKKSSPTSTNEAKSALLNDSDDDIPECAVSDTLAHETENVKNSLLHDSESEKNEDQENSQNSSSEVNKTNAAKETENLKSTLLKDSKSDKDEDEVKSPSLSSELKRNKSAVETENVKSLLLEDSESDKNENQEKNRTLSSDLNKNNAEDETENVKQSLCCYCDSEKDCGHHNNQFTTRLHECNDNEDKSADETSSTMQPGSKNTSLKDKELAKSSLLNDSSDSSSKPVGKKTKYETSVKTRRKHIMESMHAKKMLLTYSSSSDTEDEQLKNVIKNIKDDLMKNIEDDETINCVKKKIQSSSESEEGILSHARKKRKTAEDSSPRDQVAEDEKKNKEINISGSGESSDTSLKKSKSSTAKMGRSREKPGGSSNQNSDSQEDKDIEGLTNLKSLNKIRRRRDSDSENSASTRSSTRKMAKVPQIFNENLLSPDSSDEDSAAESDGPEEDLPPVSLSGLNGDGLEHLAKDDLLRESESDTSKDKSSDGKKEDESDPSPVKTKRRKAKTISSDSEASSFRRKADVVVKISDFEDSEDESSEPAKRSKRKIKSSDSDASAGSSSDGKKKRKRIQEIDSDVSGSDTENEGKSKHGRKNIRKVMGKNQLEEATKKAAREEKERLARIAERQKMYNNLEFDESGKPDEVIVDKVILDFEPETKEPLIEVDRGLVKKLKPHQANGIKFMWDACFESAKRIKKDRGSGCILAHCMGLGKTLQVVALTHTLLTHSDLTNVQRVLVVCPLSTVLNWVSEFRMWLKHAHNEPDVDVYELSRYKQNSERAFQLSQWFAHGGVCVLGYEMFRNLSADNPKKFKKKMLRQFQESLVDPGPDLVVCDEGHLLKNEKTSLSQSMNRVRTHRRIVLTGTPLQNNLKEYYCMVQFVKPNLLGKYNEYLNRFVNPITNGQYTDSTEHDIRIMKRRSHVLHKMLDGAVQRRDYGVLAPFLPPKHEYVLFITLTDVQISLYQHYLDNYSRRPLAGKSSGFLFPDFQSLQRIWTHPLVLKYNSERYEIMQQKKREREEEDSEGSLVDFIDDDSTPDESSTEDSTDDSSDMSDDSRKKSKKKKSKKSKSKDSKVSSRRNTRANPVDLVEEIGDPSLLEVKNDNPTEWWIPLVSDTELDDLRNSHKLVLLFEILRQCEAIGDKLLVFSQSLYSLDLIEHFLGKVDEATQEGRIDEKLGNHVGSWSPGIDYFRLDGSTSCENRSIWCKNFNREDNPRARLFLISTRAGGLGINLVAANRVVIFDVSWNPSHDVQSIFRVYRFGQKKPCYIYRFLAMGTMEEKIYERQVTKQAISKRVIDEQQIDRHYAENDLAELYKFEPRPPAPRPVPLVPKDRLFAEMLKEHEALIYKFHEHDSLLENKEEETLSEEERKAAWEDFENEKNRPPPQPFPAWPMHNGMPNMNMMAAQQQQLAYAALAGVLRKDMPTLSDDNIRQMLPLLYSANPAMFGGYDYGLMQKLSDMYKYAQPGMMNPQMMNMNAGSGGGGPGAGGGGTSGLQYEPPWQRQQQQQQQMRLQQLMQHQNQMGAKFYAGGLGSRDPVAMALQQQRAREIMLSGGGAGVGGGGALGAGAAGRPRGRPPLAPRAPPTTTNDVVNLDSD